MTPLDYWRSGLHLWTRTAEMQVEMTRVAFGMAEDWQNMMLKGAPFASFRGSQETVRTKTPTRKTKPAAAKVTRIADAKPDEAATDASAKKPVAKTTARRKAPAKPRGSKTTAATKLASVTKTAAPEKP
ncbi:MAG: hypothetical protein AAFY03_14020, partial [Pseudomonadota bacterium]